MDNNPFDSGDLPNHRHNPFFPSIMRLKKEHLDEFAREVSNDAKNKINRENSKATLEISRRNYRVSDIIIFYSENPGFKNSFIVWLEIKIKSTQNNILEVPGVSYERLFDFLPSTLKKGENNTFSYSGTEELLKKSLKLFGYKRVVKK